MEEDVAILGLEQLEEESAAAAAVRGPALVKSLGLLGHVPAEGQRRRLAWAWPRTLGDGIGAGVEKGRGRERSGWRGLGLVHVHPERGLQPVDRVAEGGDHLRRVRAGAWAGAVAGARARARAQAQAQARAWARAWAKLGARVRAEATLARPWP
eukprot:scaffold58817_cov70-Phaeocystis_antarctica.AAC.4